MKEVDLVSVPSLPTLRSGSSLPAGADVLAVGWSAAGLGGLPAPLEKELGRAYARQYKRSAAEVASSVGAGTELGDVSWLPAAGNVPTLLLVGLGEGDPSPADLRFAAGSLGRALRGRDGVRTAAVALGGDDPAARQAVGEGVLLGAYRYRRPQDPAPAPLTVTVLAETDDGLTDARIVATAAATAREWVNLPPNELHPGSFADRAVDLTRGTRVKAEVLDEAALAAGGYGGLMAVGGGSSRPPRLVRLSYRPRGAKRHLALVGKGITFDSGGLNLKPGDSMYTMKSDMSGAATVLAATTAIAALGLKVKVTAYGALAENLPSGSAYRPSDVLTIYGGTTVENGNSDAEGRLVLADALVRAGQDRPDLVVDVATLTGACVVALGDRTAGLMTNGDEIAADLLAAAAMAGEELWRLPIPADTKGRLESKVADLKSTGDTRSGGALIAAAFLREFVTEGTPWAHLDIAGPAFHTGSPFGAVGTGGTGYGVRTLVEFARSLAG